MSKFLITLLMLDAAAVCIGISHSWNMWGFIVAYWFILTVRNTFDFLKCRKESKERKKHENVR